MTVLTNPEILDLNKGIEKGFDKVFVAKKPDFGTELVSTFSAASGKTEMPFLGLLGRVKEFTGKAVIESIKSYGYTITDKQHELTLAIKERDMDTDTIGLYKGISSSFAISANAFFDENEADLLNKGWNTGICYDGQRILSYRHRWRQRRLKCSRLKFLLVVAQTLCTTA